MVSRQFVVAPRGVVSHALGERREAGGRIAGAENIGAAAAVVAFERERLRESLDRLRLSPPLEPDDLPGIGHALLLGSARRNLPAILRQLLAHLPWQQVDERLSGLRHEGIEID